MEKIHKLDGREFVEIDQKISAVQHDYIQGHLRLAGVYDLFVGVAISKPTDEDLIEIRKQFLTKLILSGLKSKIMAGCLVERGKAWTRTEADRNAERFDAIEDPGEIAEMTNIVAGLVISFFPLEGKSLTTSPKFSNPNGRDLAIESGAPASSETLH